MNKASKKFSLNFKSTSGFTLVEMLATVFIFSLIAVIIGGTFAQVLLLQRRAFNLQQVEENASFVLEAMAKEIRVSQIAIGPGTSCPASPANILTINHPVNGTIVYSLVGTSVRRSVNGVSTTFSSGAVEFTRLGFCISGTPAADRRQPKVTIVASLRSLNTNQQVSINVQNSVSLRYLTD